MAVIDARQDPATHTEAAMTMGGQGKMGRAFKESDQGSPGQDRVRKRKKKTDGNGTADSSNQPTSLLLQELIKYFKNKRKKEKNLEALSTARGPAGMGY